MTAGPFASPNAVRDVTGGRTVRRWAIRLTQQLKERKPQREIGLLLKLEITDETITSISFVLDYWRLPRRRRKIRPRSRDPNNNAVNSPGQNNSNAPVAGRNSFTEGQAKSKIEDAGYTNVTELKKDDNGVWRGKASKSGSATAVSVDFQGNVNTAK